MARFLLMTVKRMAQPSLLRGIYILAVNVSPIGKVYLSIYFLDYSLLKLRAIARSFNIYVSIMFLAIGLSVPVPEFPKCNGGSGGNVE